jgi:hypothetical protein
MGYSLVWDTLLFRGDPLLVGFTDSYWVSDPDDHNSTEGYVFILGSGLVTWACKK